VVSKQSKTPTTKNPRQTKPWVSCFRNRRLFSPNLTENMTTCILPGQTGHTGLLPKTQTPPPDPHWLLPWLRRGNHVLDLGARLNTCTFDAAELVFPGQLTGTSTDAARGFDLERLASGLELMNVSYRRAATRHLPFPAACFDAVLHLAVDETEIETDLAEIRRVLKPGGWLALEGMLSEDRLENVLTHSGFQLQVVLENSRATLRARATRLN
jgi:SAM-dependent methyltransferase